MKLLKFKDPSFLFASAPQEHVIVIKNNENIGFILLDTTGFWETKSTTPVSCCENFCWVAKVVSLLCTVTVGYSGSQLLARVDYKARESLKRLTRPRKMLQLYTTLYQRLRCSLSPSLKLFHLTFARNNSGVQWWIRIRADTHCLLALYINLSLHFGLCLQQESWVTVGTASRKSQKDFTTGSSSFPKEQLVGWRIFLRLLWKMFSGR